MSIAPTNVSCFGGSNGSILVTANGGTSAYNVSWSGTASGNPAGNEIAVSGGNYSIVGLSAGTYQISLTDANGCIATVTQSVTAPAALAATAVAQSYSCFGGTGGVSLTVTGGTFPHTYSWTGPGGFTSTAQNINGAAIGIYNVTVIDANLCTTTTTATVSGPATAVSITLDNKTNVSCSNGTNGSINITATGGTPGYMYVWSDASTLQDRTGLAADTYTVTVTDANGCTTTQSEVITEPLPMVVSTTQTSVLCNGGSSGSIAVTTTGGTAPYEISWSGAAIGNPAGVEIAADGGSYTITGLIAGAYVVSVTDANGCLSTVSRTVAQPAVLTSTAVPINYLCFGQTGGINLTVNGGTPPYLYSWTGPGGFTSSMEDISGVTAGTYNVTVTDANNCTVADVTSITGPTVPIQIVGTGDDEGVSCFGAADGRILFAIINGTPPYAYTYQSNTGFTGSGSIANSGSYIIGGLAAGNYTIALTDANGCTANHGGNILQPPPLVLSVTKIDPTCPPGANPLSSNDGSINLTVTGGKTTFPDGFPIAIPFTYVWTTTDGSGLNPTAEDQLGLTVGTYTVVVTNLISTCTATISVTLTNILPVPTTPTSID